MLSNDTIFYYIWQHWLLVKVRSNSSRVSLCWASFVIVPPAGRQHVVGQLLQHHFNGGVANNDSNHIPPLQHLTADAAATVHRCRPNDPLHHHATHRIPLLPIPNSLQSNTFILYFYLKIIQCFYKIRIYFVVHGLPKPKIEKDSPSQNHLHRQNVRIMPRIKTLLPIRSPFFSFVTWIYVNS